MGSVNLREALADRERLGITEVLETERLESPVAGLRTCGGPEEASDSTFFTTLLIVSPTVHGGAGQLEALRHSAALSLGNICCAALTEAHEIPPSWQRFSERTGAAIFASCFDAWLLKSRLVGLLAEKDDRRVTVHGVLVQVAGVGVLITGESGIGKTLCSLELACSGEGWVADDAVVLEARGDALYGRGHERTKGLIALRDRGICRAEGVLGRAALRDAVRVELIIRMQSVCKGGDIAAGSLPTSVRKIVGISLPCHCLGVDGEPRRMAGGVREIVRVYLASGVRGETGQVRGGALEWGMAGWPSVGGERTVGSDPLISREGEEK